MPEARKVNMTATFSLKFNSPILPRQTVVGVFDGKHPCLTCATTGGKLMIHNSHDDAAPDPVRFLNINRPTTALRCGRHPKGYDILYIGSQTTILAYNVESNSNVFFREIGEGVNAAAFGSVRNIGDVILVGGNCSIQGFDHSGEEKLWNVASANVTTLELLPWERNGPNILLVGSDDLEIRGLLNEETVARMTETSTIIQLQSTLHPGRFAYGLSNGTVGLYDKSARTWRHKAKHGLVSIGSCDVDFDGFAEILVGWDNGKFEVRSDAGLRNGEATYKDTLPSSVSGVLGTDYRMDGRQNPIVCSYDGEVRGYVAVETSMHEAVEEFEEAALEKAIQRLQNVKFEIASIEKQMNRRQEEKAASEMPTGDVKLSVKIKPNSLAKGIDLVLSVSAGAVIHGAVMSAEVVFGANDTRFISADVPSESLTATLHFDKDFPVDIRLQVLVGYAGAATLQVVEQSVKLPKFAMFVPVKEFANDPEGTVLAMITERANRMVMWANAGFSGYQAENKSKESKFEARFVSLRDGAQIMIIAANNTNEVMIKASNIDVAGEIVQDFGQFLGLADLETTADFPVEFSTFSEVLNRVDEYNAARLKFSGGIAESTNQVKALVIKAEDARIQNEMRLMKKTYGMLYEYNREVLGEFMKRNNNHTELLAALKDVNLMIQRASRLRIGAPSRNLVLECKSAIKEQNIHALFHIIRQGANK